MQAGDIERLDIARRHARMRSELLLLEEIAREIGRPGIERLEQPPGNVAGLAVIEVTRLDGVKLILEDGSWLLFRLSGTEPVVCLHAEAPTEEGLDRLITAGEVLFGR